MFETHAPLRSSHCSCVRVWFLPVMHTSTPLLDTENTPRLNRSSMRASSMSGTAEPDTANVFKSKRCATSTPSRM